MSRTWRDTDRLVWVGARLKQVLKLAWQEERAVQREESCCIMTTVPTADLSLHCITLLRATSWTCESWLVEHALSSARFYRNGGRDWPNTGYWLSCCYLKQVHPFPIRTHNVLKKSPMYAVVLALGAPVGSIWCGLHKSGQMAIWQWSSGGAHCLIRQAEV